MSVAQALQELEQILQREKSTGETRISISPDSVALLQQLPSTFTASIQPAESTPAPAADPAPQTSRVHEGAPPEAVSQLASLVAPDLISVEGDTKRDRLNNLFRALKKDASTRLPTLRDQLVFAKGNPEADIMFVGEAPGFEEEKQRKPFVGPAGQMLDRIVGAMGLDPAADIYVSNIVKYRPRIGDGTFQGQKNRKPNPDEMSAMLQYVLTEIDIVQPKAIVALGGTAAEGLLGLAGSVSKMRNQFYEVRSIPTMVTYHPSYLLRSESSSPNRGKAEKRKVWEDLLLVMEKTDLQISEKQRGYFL